MLINPTVDGLYTLNLPAMARALVEQRERADHHALSFEERLGLLVDLELQDRENRRLQRSLKTAKLRGNAVIEDLDLRRPRGLDRSQMLNLAESLWVANHHNVLIVGATGLHSAIRHRHSALYLRGPRMLDELAIARADGRLTRLLASWARVDVLVIDDFGLRPLTPDQAADLLEVVEDRAQLRSTVVTSQLPVAHWHEALGEPTVADAILDRLLQNAHRVELAGESMRRPDKLADGTNGSNSRRRSENRLAETPVEAR